MLYYINRVDVRDIGFTAAYCWALAIACISIVTAFAAYNGSKSTEVLLLVTLYHTGFMVLGVALYLNGHNLVGPNMASDEVSLFGLLLVHGAFVIACIHQMFQKDTTKSKKIK